MAAQHVDTTVTLPRSIWEDMDNKGARSLRTGAPSHRAGVAARPVYVSETAWVAGAARDASASVEVVL